MAATGRGISRRFATQVDFSNAGDLRFVEEQIADPTA
jgi:hypothetical protein